MTETNIQESSSVMESICDDDELFFGPITDKERIVKERFEKRMQERGILLPKLSNIIDDVSEDSIYESFSTESKYDSFDDSLYEEQNDLNPKKLNLSPGDAVLNPKEVDLIPEEKNLHPKEISASNFLSEQVNANNRRQCMDKKSIAGHFCDSLEDIHSLVSSGDRFSLSEEIEDINIMEISHTCEDSLMNDICIANKNSNSNEPYDSLIHDICVPNKNSNSNEQYFDEDSLAIVDHEKAFDDSLEDSNGPISHVDSLILSKSKVGEVDPLIEMSGSENRGSKGYFETSIDVIYENSKEVNTDFKDLNLDRNSISECKNIFRDSLEEISELSNNAPKVVSKEMDMQEDGESLPTSNLHSDVYSAKINNETKSSILVSDVTDFGLGAYKVKCRKSSTEFLKPLDVRTKSDTLNFNETVCIDDSNLTECGSTFTKSPMKSKDSDIEGDFQMLLNPPSSNDTICIDDSIILPSESAYYSFPKYNSYSKYRACSDDLGSIEVEKCHTVSPNPIIAPSSNDTICIEDSMIEATEAALNSFNTLALDASKKKSVFTENELKVDVFTSQSLHAAKEMICDDSLYIPPLESTMKEEKIPLNKTICIDDSIISPVEPTLEEERISPIKSKETKKKRNSSLSKKFEKDFQKLRISDVDKKHRTSVPTANLDSPSSARNTVIDIIVRSPLHECRKKNIVIEHPNLKDKTKTHEDANTIAQETLIENNLKLHIEVAIDEGQHVNVVSVSSADQGSLEECASPNEDNKCISRGVNKFELKDQARINTSKRSKRNFGLKTSVIDSPTSSPLEKVSGVKDKAKVTRNRHSDYFSVNLETHDAKLLQALDLHDTSCNLGEVGPVQSRDSIMPLNLCTREKLFEKRNKTVFRNESKENIPFTSSTKYKSKELNIPNNQKYRDSPKNKGTPQKKNTTKQELNNINEVKRSGGKINSATKIPIRKIDNTPVSLKKKPEFKPIPNSGKSVKSLFVTPACPSAVSQKDVPGETPKKNHHFCMVRNSISKVPKSAQKIASKKFQNIQSPIAQYIGNHQVYPPLKTTQNYDGNLFLTNVEPVPQFVKTAKNTVLVATPGSVKADKKF